MKHFSTTLRFLSLAAVLLLGLSAAAFGQETTARVTGQITDQAGAIVNNAEVRLTNTGTLEERPAKTDESGYYSLTLIPPGVYDLSVRLQGFKEYINKGLEISVNDRKTINIALEPGSVNESVTVISEAPLIQNTPTLGDVIENRRVVELPLNNRNFMQLIVGIPGVTSAGGSEIGIGLANRVDISINGQRRNSINFLVDGVTNTDVGSNITLLSVPTIDSIQEFRVITSVPTAEFGRSGGGVVNLITRGGTREFHGGLYEFVRNDKLNANSFFNNAAGRNPDGTIKAPRARLRYNNFGYNIGGPVFLPRFGEGAPSVYGSKRDRTFFFFSHEWRRIIRQPAQNIITIPSLRERTGDFSESGNVTIFDPLTGNPFPGNRIPSNRINPTAASVLSVFPTPNIASLVTGRDPNRFSVIAPDIQNTRQEVVRIDHNFSSDARLTARYTHDLSQTREQGGLFFGASLPNLATTATNIPGQVLAITLTKSFGSNVVNEVSFNYSSNQITTTLVGQYADAVKIPNKEVFAENNSRVPPTLIIGGLVLGANQLFGIQYNNYNPKDNLTWVRGPHTFKFGADISFEQKNENAANETQGRFTFNGVQTRQTGVSAGIGFADFLLGRASAYSEAERDITNNLRFGRSEFYAQDTWKIRPNFQLDYGIRYHRFRQPFDKNNVLTAFFPELFKPANAPPFANVTGTLLVNNAGNPANGIAIAGKNSPFGRRVQKTDKNDFAPRIGFAWDPHNDSRTVLRGGYGIYYDQVLVGIVEQNTFVNPPFNNAASFTGTVTSPIPFSDPQLGVAPSTLPVRPLITTTDPFVTPIIQQWNLTIQRQLTKASAIEIGYVGSAGNHLIRPVDINAPTPQEILAAAKGVAGCDTALSASNNPNTCINLARPYKGFAAITDRQTTATSRYHALISSFRLQPTRGLSGQISYTFSKNLTDATNDRDAVDLPQIRTNFHLERAVSRLDRTHIFGASYVYEVPTFTTGFFATPLIRHMISGFQFAGLTTAQSGLALNRVVQGSGVGPRGSRPDILSDPSQNIPANPNGGIPYAFNPLAFRPAAIGQIGSSGRAPFRLPRIVATDLNVAKNFRFTERYRLQFRAEFFNIFNHTIFDDVFQTIPDRLQTDPAFNSIENLIKISSFGQFFSTRRPREIQLGLKFYF